MADAMEKFCGQPFWDNELSWNTTSPELTECFNKTVLIWLPPAFLLIFSPVIIRGLINANYYIRWNFLNVFRQIVSLAIIILSLGEFIAVLVRGAKDKDFSNLGPDLLAAIIKILSSIAIFAFLILQKRRGLHTSGVIWFYLLFTIICGAPTIHAYIHWHSPTLDARIFFSTQYALTIALFFIYCFSDTVHTHDTKDDDKRDECPKESASFLSRLLFSWFTPMAILGWKKPLTVSDLWKIRERDKSANIHKLFHKNWLSQVKSEDITSSLSNGDANHTFKEVEETSPKQTAKKKKMPGILVTMARSFWFYWVSGAVFRLFNDVLGFASPQILKVLILFIANPSEPDWHGYFYAGALFFTTIVQILTQNYYFNRMLVIGMRIRSCLVAAVYRKSLRLSNAAKNESTVGEIVNLMAVDAQRFVDMTQFINLIWSAPIQIALALYFLWQELGISVLGGVAIMVLMIPTNGFLTRVIRKLQMKQMKLKDERVKAMNEILNGIKVLKLYGWEKAFMDNILKIRDRELNHLKKINNFSVMLLILWNGAPFLVSFATFAIYVLIDDKNVLDAQKAFVSLSLFNILRQPLNMLPNLVTALIQVSVSVKRLNKFLNHSELGDYVTRNFDEKYALEIRNADFAWSTAQNGEESTEKTPQNTLNDINLEIPKSTERASLNTLNDISLKIPKKSFVAIVGSVGMGKSSLLSAILGDMELNRGSVNLCSTMKIAYVPQIAWIQNATLKNNILFGKEDDAQRYDRIINACELIPDLSILPGGDNTEIGEKGINLSGGQKQRVSLARACFSDSDLYLLDDPLSAVDSHVGKNIFEEVLNSSTGLLKDKTRILVTNSLSVLPHTDLIVVLKDGSISEIGTYKQLLSNKKDFAELIEQYSSGNETTDEDSKDEKADKSTVALNDKSKLVETEGVETGRVKLSVYKRYFLAISKLWCFFILTYHALQHAFTAGSSVWLSIWSDESNSQSDRTGFYLGIYGVLGFAQVLFVGFGWHAITHGMIRASRLLHYNMLYRILRSPMSFFDTTPLGRILNRFGKDVDVCDTGLQWAFRIWLNTFFPTLATLIIISMEIPIFLAVIVPIAVMFYFIQSFYVVTSRQLKRLESITKSPLYSHFSETLSGVATIRAYSLQNRFIKESDDRLDRNQECFYPNVVANRWLSIRLEMVANFIILFTALFAVIYRRTLEPGTVGLIVSYALSITVNLNWLVRCTADIETNVVSVERILEYSDLNSEADWYIDSTAPASGWPFNGVIKFNEYSTKYRTGLDLVLKQISMNIKSGEKVGIVGRTGAGKSSLTLALFRLIEPTNGTIIIDDVNIRVIGLNQLRSRLTIIPQDPVLFSGTIRINLDPFGVYSDDQLWNCLEMSHLKPFIASLELGLEHKVAEGGDNLSVGQRQLICLARALLRNTRVLILDEATAAVDLETDSLIQATIRKAFAECTVLTIAHRLHTILDSDRVLVLNDGSIAEFDSPSNLLHNQQSIFYSLAKDAKIVS